MEESAKVSEIEAAYDNPPKNYVRDQWASAAEQRRQRNGVSYINYLTFPGPQCLDVELFRDRGLIRMTGNVYDKDSLTFCENRPLAYSLIRSRLPNAKDIHLEFEELVGAGQPAGLHPWVRDKRLFPYDVVNLDFERPPFVFRDRAYSRQIAAIEKVFYIQREYQHSFTLFVTFPAEDGQIDPRGQAFIEQTVRSNLENGPSGFVNGYKERFGDNGISTSHYGLYLVVVPKVVLRSGTDNGFKVMCDGRYTYVGKPKLLTRMISFVFECDFQGGPVHQQPPLFGTLQEHYENELIKLVGEEAVDVNELLATDEGTPSST